MYQKVTATPRQCSAHADLVSNQGDLPEWRNLCSRIQTFWDIVRFLKKCHSSRFHSQASHSHISHQFQEHTRINTHTHRAEWNMHVHNLRSHFTILFETHVCICWRFHVVSRHHFGCSWCILRLGLLKRASWMLAGAFEMEYDCKKNTVPARRSSLTETKIRPTKKQPVHC